MGLDIALVEGLLAIQRKTKGKSVPANGIEKKLKKTAIASADCFIKRFKINGNNASGKNKK